MVTRHLDRGTFDRLYAAADPVQKARLDYIRSHVLKVRAAKKGRR